jgi:hypothetical protein
MRMWNAKLDPSRFATCMWLSDMHSAQRLIVEAETMEYMDRVVNVV